MSLSVATRFEVFKRDAFRCVYCGRTPDDGVVLEADHVLARAEGGPDELANLVTSCWDCNHGKGARSLDATAPPLARAMTDAQGQTVQLDEYRHWLEGLRNASSSVVQFLWDEWVDSFGGRRWEEGDSIYWEASVGVPSRSALLRYVNGLPPDELLDAVHSTARKWHAGGLVDYDVLRYFFGTLKQIAGHRIPGAGSAEQENARLRELFLNREDHGYETFSDVVYALWPDAF